ncbi:hypothetical protein Acid345_0641 [Candidatus Koribacter versatilis Ellin345]|uniref:Aldose 1-epimerase n=1 Tax=Koribacter versatilis (strain Ellin345) TaxID=204669 RepID=Q1IU04_KORVE|nr:aldose 1-epimerase [Candidatus Koribacter versatilis]ABF39646.1 hypothetical protein Acid345_0641 [Candidatus Koribacter versatilis Ellin345]
MNRCEAAPITWKGRRAFRLTNGTVEITVLLGGGHIADFRLCGSPYNTLFESPWSTIEPSQFSSQLHSSSYGDGPIGRLLCGYTGHALALGYFGLPDESESNQGLPLHGEAVASDWKISYSNADDVSASVTMEALLPVYGLRAERTLLLSAGASTVHIEERVTNVKHSPLDFQWVEHAAFGEPLFSAGEAKLYLSANQCRTWPLGYEDRESLVVDRDFDWPHAPWIKGHLVDLSLPFDKNGTGFVAALLTEPERSNAYIAVHNRRLELAAGYVFDRCQFPWIALWEENCARSYPPWNGVTRARGVEFGNSPIPLGLQHAKEMKTLFDVPVFSTIQAGETIATSYQIFVTPMERDWPDISDLREESGSLAVHSQDGRLASIPTSGKP